MKTKLVYLMFSITLVLVASLTDPKSTEANCSGDLCECYLDAHQCQAECLLLPPSQQIACGNGCVQDSVRCARACCGGAPQY
jgi:hypothetical protein